METFTASNGREVSRNDMGNLVVDQISPAGRYVFSPDQTLAMREFFLHERDQELGRWRFPRVSSGYVVYPKVNGSVRVVEEITGQSEVVTRESVNDDLGAWWNEVADAYFTDHPVPMPWHDAKPGEVWLLTANGDEFPAIKDVEGVFYTLKTGNHRVLYPERDGVTAGKRIWPEGEKNA